MLKKQAERRLNGGHDSDEDRKKPFDVKRLTNIATSKKQQLKKMQIMQAEQEARDEEERLKKLAKKKGLTGASI